MVSVVAFLVGLVFGAGLLVSDMADPAKVLAFLDVAGRWDPSLAFVMVGAIAVAAALYAWARRRTRSWLGLPMQWPAAGTVDRRLVVGSLAFGVGWGLAGLCPGPALVLLGLGVPEAIVFVAAMAAGMGLFEAAERWRRARRGVGATSARS